MGPNFTFQRSILSSILSLTIAGAVLGQKGAIGEDPIASQLSNRDANTVALPKNVTRDWFKSAVAGIEASEYRMIPAGKAGQFAAINKLQQLGYLFDGSGYGVNNYGNDRAAAWHARFTLAGVGRGLRLHKAALRTVTAAGDRSVQYDHADYMVMYDNREQGMEQSILLRKRPAGRQWLEVVMDLGGDLEARLDGADQLKLFPAGKPADVKLIYDQFKVWDKNGKALAAHMRLDGGRRLVLSVDDSHAAYPVTIDPLNHTPGATFNLGGVLSTSVSEITAPVLGGFSVAGGDVNGDGASDIIIGAPLFHVISIAGGAGTVSGVAKGAVFVYYGHVAGAPDATPAQVLQPSTLGDGSLFGFSVATVPNLDGDTKADIIVGAPLDSVNFPGILPTIPDLRLGGKVYVFKGSSMGTDVNTKPAPASSLHLNLGLGGGQFLNIAPLYGFSVASAGDITNDGLGDIIIGSPGYSTGTGAADIYYGANNANGVSSLTPVTTLTGTIGTSLFGYSVAGAGHVNNDAFSDVIVGAPGNIISLLAGSAYVFHGSATGIPSVVATSANTVLTAPGSTLGTLFGFSVSSAGDVNNDGHSDVIVGEPLRLTLGSAAGRAYIYYGTNTAGGLGTSPTPSTLTSPRAGTIARNLLFGFSVSTAGNVVQDIADDVLVGEPGSTLISNTTLLSSAFSTLGLTLNTATSVLNGAVYLYKGQNAAAGITTGQAPYWTLMNSDLLTAGDLLGTNVHYAGDVNGDGFADLMVTAPAGGLDLGLNLSNQSALSGTLSIGSGLLGSGNASGTAGNAYLFFGFSAALPVTLLDFTAHPDNGNVLLSWSTSSETNSDHFEIERSIDNSTFTSIGQVASAHNSSTQTDYNFTDLSPNNGVNYYRLKMVDMDGQFTYSKVVTVELNNTGARMIKAYPNPAHGSFQLVFRNMPEGRYDVNMVNAIGQVMMQKRIQVSNIANFTQTIDVSYGMAAGSYLLRVVDQQQNVYTSRVVVQ